MNLPDWTTLPPGSATDLCLRPEVGADIELPGRLVRGVHGGPTLLVTAGVHGAEYASIEAAVRLARDTDPHTLAGTLIVLPIVNPPAFSARSVYVNPLDGKNLNRCFPGRAGGSYAERLAHWLTTALIARVDALVDLHGGDLVEALSPFCVVPAGDEGARALGLAFGLPHLTFSGGAGMSISAARALGVPALIAEAGGQGQWPQAAVELLVGGARRVMAHLGMIPPQGEPPPVREHAALAWLSAPQGGLWYPRVSVGEEVEVGQPLGELRDALGTLRAEIRAPAPGVVLFAVTGLAMNAGDPLYGLGSPAKELARV